MSEQFAPSVRLNQDYVLFHALNCDTQSFITGTEAEH